MLELSHITAKMCSLHASTASHSVAAVFGAWVMCVSAAVALTISHPLSDIALDCVLLLPQLTAAGKKVHIVAPDYGEYARSHKM